MTKRNGNFDAASSKKPKLDDLWGEDLDSSAIEDCFRLATQVVEQNDLSCTQHNNVTILPTYSAFKHPKGMFTSTQFNASFNLPSGSNGTNGTSLELRMKQLQEKYEEKEGEVSILRANLKEMRTSTQAEQEKRNIEWREKLKATEREMKAIKSELEFKNLEVANLRQRVVEVSKFESSTQRQKAPMKSTPLPPKKGRDPVGPPNTRIRINSQPFYPLKTVDFSVVFRMPKTETYRVSTKYNMCKNAVPFLQNQLTEDESNFLTGLKQKTIVVDGRELNLDYIYPELSFLIGCSLTEINNERGVEYLTKVLCVSLQFLFDFRDFLKRIQENVTLQEIQQADSAYLDGNNKAKFIKRESLSECHENELGVNSAKVLTFLSELLPFSTHLSDYILRNKQLNVDETTDYARLLPCITTKKYKRCHLLNAVSDIVSIIGKIRKASNCSGFLSSVIRLLTNAFKSDHVLSSLPTVCDITKELLLARPSFEVIDRMSCLLLAASKHSAFVDSLCFQPDGKTVKTNTTKGVSYFSKESCPFHVFAVLFENMLTKMDDDDLSLGLSSIVLSFIHNTFVTDSDWLSQQERKQCECLCHLYRLGISIIYRSRKKYKRGRAALELYTDLFRCSISVLRLLTFNSYDLIEKYVTSYAQYREIINSLNQLKTDLGLNEEDVVDLERLSISDEIPAVPNSSFASVDF